VSPRRGFLIALDAGVGQLRDPSDQTSNGFGLHLTLGGWLSPRLAIAGELGGVSVDSAGVTWTQSFYGASIIGYVHPRVYLTGGLGLSTLTESVGSDKASSASHGTLMVGAGVMLYRSGGFEMNLDLHLYGANVDELGGTVTGATLGLGLQWD
jgi:hypothetical protein